jgi:DNA-binding transcriptional regulator PaaX
VDPALPRELLPEDWPGRRAYDLFHELNSRWRPVAHEHYLQLEARIGVPAAEKAGKPHES